MLLTFNVVDNIVTKISCEWKFFLDLKSDKQLLQAGLDFFCTYTEVLIVL